MWRRDFPLIDQHDGIYLDSAASAQKPTMVIAAMDRFYRRKYANVHRSLYPLADAASSAYEGARSDVARFIRAREDEVVFVRNATEGINLVAQSFARPRLGPGKRIVVSAAEHHANMLPWLEVCRVTGAELVTIGVDDRGELDWAALALELREPVVLVAIHHVSNVLGTVLDVTRVAGMAHAAGAQVLVDGAQAVPHLAVDVAQLGADFYVFSGHKMYGPSGIGVLWGRTDLLQAMPPYQLGGDMVTEVRYGTPTYAPPPHRFEAGTPAVVEAVGLSAAIQYLDRVGYPRIASHEGQLLHRLQDGLSRIDGLQVVGGSVPRIGVVPFVVDGVHGNDLAMMLGSRSIAIRAGFHCAQPLHETLGLAGSCRASVGIYNTLAEIDTMVETTNQVVQGLRALRARRQARSGGV